MVASATTQARANDPYKLRYAHGTLYSALEHCVPAWNKQRERWNALKAFFAISERDPINRSLRGDPRPVSAPARSGPVAATHLTPPKRSARARPIAGHPSTMRSSPRLAADSARREVQHAGALTPMGAHREESNPRGATH